MSKNAKNTGVLTSTLIPERPTIQLFGELEHLYSQSSLLVQIDTRERGGESRKEERFPPFPLSSILTN